MFIGLGLESTIVRIGLESAAGAEVGTEGRKRRREEMSTDPGWSSLHVGTSMISGEDGTEIGGDGFGNGRESDIKRDKE